MTTSFAQASVSPAATKINSRSIVDQIVTSVVERPRVLVGMTNAERVLGSTSFSLPLIRQNQRAELRATLRSNHQGQMAALGPSSNPELFHLDVNYLTATSSLNQGVRLTYRKSHTAPASIGTRIITYDAPVHSSMGPGRLIATVQQRAIPEQHAWKTTATLIQFVSK
jgi:hypothetical protein